MNFIFAATSSCSNSFFFLPNWWEYLPKQPAPPNCVVTLNNSAGNFDLTNIWAIGLAILDMLLRIGGFVAVISIVVAGIQYIMATGEPEKGANARKRLTNSLIGLAIVLIAAGAVSFIGKSIG